MSDIALDWLDLLVILSVLAAFGTLAGLGAWLIRRFAAPKRIEPPAHVGDARLIELTVVSRRRRIPRTHRGRFQKRPSRRSGSLSR